MMIVRFSLPLDLSYNTIRLGWLAVGARKDTLKLERKR
jgi:hypothetical protein